MCALIFFLQVRGQCLQQDSTHDRFKVFIYDFHPLTASYHLLKIPLDGQFALVLNIWFNMLFMDYNKSILHIREFNFRVI